MTARILLFLICAAGSLTGWLEPANAHSNLLRLAEGCEIAATYKSDFGLGYAWDVSSTCHNIRRFRHNKQVPEGGIKGKPPGPITEGHFSLRAGTQEVHGPSPGVPFFVGLVDRENNLIETYSARGSASEAAPKLDVDSLQGLFGKRIYAWGRGPPKTYLTVDASGVACVGECTIRFPFGAGETFEDGGMHHTNSAAFGAGTLALRTKTIDEGVSHIFEVTISFRTDGTCRMSSRQVSGGPNPQSLYDMWTSDSCFVE